MMDLPEPKTRAIFAVPPQVQLLDLTGPAHVFYEARIFQPEIEIIFISMEGKNEVESCTGLGLNNLQDFRNYELGPKDWLIIPGLESYVFFEESIFDSILDFLDWIKVQAERDAKVCSVCTGAYILAKAGILDGKSCTTHWKYLREFPVRFPKVNLLGDRLFVKDGNVYSSAGVSSGIDLSLYLLEEVYGSLLAIKVAKEMVIYLRRTQDDPQLSAFLQFRNHLENRIHNVQDFMSNHLDRTHSLEDLAENVNMSSRNLIRLFKYTTGITLGMYREKLRLEKAVHLLAGGEKVEVIAQSCGLKSSNQIRSLFKKYRGILPSQMS